MTCNPYGHVAFPAVVRCDGCGEEIDSGWMHSYSGKYDGNDCLLVDREHHWCDECSGNLGGDRTEFRTCVRCGKPMTEGMTNEGNGLGADFHCHEECFEKAMDSRYGKGMWRESPTSGLGEGENGGYYDELLDDGTWEDTGIFYTEWY